MLSKLQEKAKRSYDQISTTGPIEGPFDNPEDIEDDLAIFGGQMKVLSRKGKSNAHQRSTSTSGSVAASSSVGSPQSQSSSSTNVSPKLAPQAAAVLGLGMDFPEVHPSLIMYLNQDAVRRAMAQGAQQREGEAPPAINQAVPEAAGNFTTGTTSGSRGGPIPGVAALLEGNTSTQRRPQHMDTSPDIGSSFDDSRRRLGSSFSHLQHPQQYSSDLGPSRDWSMFNSLGATNPSGLSSSNLSAYTDSTLGSRGFDHRVSSSQARSDQDGISFSDSLRSASSSYPKENVYSSAANTNVGHSFTQPYFQRPGSYANLPEHSQPAAVYSAGLDSGGGAMQARMGGMGGSSVNDISSVGWTGDGVNLVDAVEMGLSSGSGMDAGWMSFMRDCGIMDTDG